MTAAHRRSHSPARLSRRWLLGLAAVAAVPAATYGVHQARSRNPPADTASPASNASVAPTAAPPPVVVGSGGGTVPFHRGKVLLGAYLGLDGLSLRDSIALRRRQLGRDERIVHVFYGWSDTLPAAIGGLPATAIPMISWRGTGYAAILNGSADAHIAASARRLAAFGRPVLLRFAWEMNGDWYPWGGANNGQDTAGYIRCWRRLHDIFAAQGAKNVSWVWSPNWNNSPGASWNRFQAYYPGDKYVDWVGVSGYNLHRESPETLFKNIYAAYSARKPIMIAEVGSVERGGSTKADWIDVFAAWVEARPAVGAVAWFDTDTHPGTEEHWRIDSNAISLAAYRTMANDPWFAG
jgi:glycosyl hydrolase family 26